MLGLPPNRLIKVDVVLSPTGAQFLNMDTLLIVSDDAAIKVDERIRSYADIDSVAGDFGSSGPVFTAAETFFAQTPAPEGVYVGRWARTATNGFLVGGTLTTAQQLLSNFTAVVNGGFHVSVNGGASTNVTGINLSGALNLNGVATLISTAMTGAGLGAVMTWDGERFQIQSTTTGATSSVSFLTAPTAGVDLSPLLAMNNVPGNGARTVVGIAAETPLAAITALDQQATYWYGLMFAASTMPTTNDMSAVAAFIDASESTGRPHVFGATTQEAGAIDATSTTDLAAVIHTLAPKRTFTVYSSTNAYAAAALFGVAFTTDWAGENTAYTLMWKQANNVVAEQLRTNEADALQNKRCNVFVAYSNETSIVQYGTMAGLYFFDEVHGTDWLANQIQVNEWNILCGARKIPQTDPGTARLLAGAEAACIQGIRNGLGAPGVWRSDPFGVVKTNDFLPKGYYCFAPPVATQAQADRAARKKVTQQIGFVLAGAIHTAHVIVNVSR
jgi:hypothetical protein